jgi:hypothetical protein
MIDSSCAVTVTDQEGHKRQAVGRAARIIWLCLIYQDRLNGARRGRMSFNFGEGEKVSPELLDLLEGGQGQWVRLARGGYLPNVAQGLTA